MHVHSAHLLPSSLPINSAKRNMVTNCLLGIATVTARWQRLRACVITRWPSHGVHGCDATLAGIAVLTHRGAAWFRRAETNMARVKRGRKKCVYSQQRHKKRHWDASQGGARGRLIRWNCVLAVLVLMVLQNARRDRHLKTITLAEPLVCDHRGDVTVAGTLSAFLCLQAMRWSLETFQPASVLCLKITVGERTNSS